MKVPGNRNQKKKQGGFDEWNAFKGTTNVLTQGSHNQTEIPSKSVVVEGKRKERRKRKMK